MNFFMKRCALVGLAFMFWGVFTRPAFSAITVSGDVDPTNPSVWKSVATGFVGKTSVGTLEVNGGSTASVATCYLGYSTNASGKVLLTGTGSKWLSGLLYVGNSGGGEFDITLGGSANVGTCYLGGAAGGNGVVSVGGLGSTLSGNLVIGNGTLDVADGGTVTGTYGVGTVSGKTGTMNIVGNGTIGNGNLSVGYGGMGILNVKQGGVLQGSDDNAQWTRIGGSVSGSRGEVNIDGAGSRWLNSGYIFCGDVKNANFFFHVTNGGTITGRGARFGMVAGSTGLVVVDGPGSSWIMNDPSDNDIIPNFVAGSAGISIRNGGKIDSGISCVAANYDGGSSSVTVDGADSSWHAKSLYIGSLGDLGVYSNGELNISHGAKVAVDDKLVLSNNYQGVGKIAFGEGGGTVTVHSLWYPSDKQLSGAGTINTNGIVSYDSLTFDATHGLNQTFTYNGATVNLSQDASGDLGALYLSIQDGMKVASRGGFGSFGINVQGAGSAWTVEHLDFTSKEHGILKIWEGGLLECRESAIIGSSANTCDFYVNGTGSAFSSKNLLLGTRGKARLWISYEGTVNVAETTEVGGGGTTGGSIIVNRGGKMKTGTFIASPSQISGDGTIDACGLVSDIDLTFDAAHDLSQTLDFGGVGVHLMQNATGILGAGNIGSGSLVIRDGKNVSSLSGYIGYKDGSKGVATVEGIGSKWTSNAGLYLGSSNTGQGILNIAGGGEVFVASGIFLLQNNSILAIDVGSGSKLNAMYGTGIVSNNGGTIRLVAGASPAADFMYNPILAQLSSSGSGKTQALGGKWDSLNKTFTVSAVLPGVSGLPVSIDRLSTQRVLFEDSSNHWTLGTSFLSADSSTPLTCTATAADGSLQFLRDALSPDDKLLGGWTLSADSGYAAGDPIYLSFGEGTAGGYASKAYQVWSFDGAKWSKFAASDLTSDGKYASFTIAALGTYAVTVPEPSMAILAAFGLLGLAAILRKSRRR